MRHYLHRIGQANRVFNKKLNGKISPLGLYSSQWSIILCLHYRSNLTQVQLSNFLNVEAPTITRTLTRLEEMGWVIRSEGEDKRERYVSLSPRAEEKFPEWLQEAAELEALALRDIDEQDLEVFNRVLKQITDNLES